MIYPKFCGWNSGSSNSVSSQFKGLILADVRFCVAVLPATLPLKVMPAVVTRSVGWELTGQQHRDSLLPKRGSSMASSSQGRQCYGLFFPREETLWPLLPKGGNAMASSSQGRRRQGFSASQGRQCRAEFNSCSKLKATCSVYLATAQDVM